MTGCKENVPRLSCNYDVLAHKSFSLATQILNTHYFCFPRNFTYPRQIPLARLQNAEAPGYRLIGQAKPNLKTE